MELRSGVVLKFNDAGEDEHADEINCPREGRRLSATVRSASPELQCVRDGFIPFGSVAVLLSRRAKQMALKALNENAYSSTDRKCEIEHSEYDSKSNNSENGADVDGDYDDDDADDKYVSYEDDHENLPRYNLRRKSHGNDSSYSELSTCRETESRDFKMKTPEKLLRKETRSEDSQSLSHDSSHRERMPLKFEQAKNNINDTQRGQKRGASKRQQLLRSTNR